jgi:hypothetical protein
MPCDEGCRRAVCGRTACTVRCGGGRQKRPVGYVRAAVEASRRPYIAACVCGVPVSGWEEHRVPWAGCCDGLTPRPRRSRGSYHPLMSDSQEIAVAIGARIAEARAEIASLEGAISALTGAATAAGTQPAAAPPGRTAPGRTARGSRRRRSSTGSAPRSSELAGVADAAPVRATRSRSSRRSSRSTGSTIEELLRGAPGGLSAAALAKRTGLSYARVTARLRDLAQEGDVRSSGARRTSLWHWVTQEQRIAERAAELEKAVGPKDLTAS